MNEDFETFWRAYPRRISKGRAEKAFAKAVKQTALPIMLEAISAYIENKPIWRDYQHPATWLNDKGWLNEWTQPERQITPLMQATMDMIDGQASNRSDLPNGQHLAYAARH
jgi:hypothetical protein